MRAEPCPSKKAMKKPTIIYGGSKLPTDEPNETMTRLASLFRSSASLHELYQDKLYLAYLTDDSATGFINSYKERSSDMKFLLLPFNYTEIIHYQPFNCDFGPLSLGSVHMFASRLKVIFDTIPQRDVKSVVIVLGGIGPKTKMNATLIIALTALILFDLTDLDIIKRLQLAFMHPSCKEVGKPVYLDQAKFFSDVSGLRSQFKLSIQDCIKGFYLAMKEKFYNYYTFDHIEYLHFELVHTGDINWIIPGKLLAFAGPSDTNSERHSPGFYFDYFKERKVTDIVRLNSADYNAKIFTEAGFKHHDLIFPDGFPPTSTIARRFIKLTLEAEGAVAVHCFAGIGRTGTLIAAYLMAKHNFTAEEAIAWTRICRPGSVIGDQQDWLLNQRAWLTGNWQTIKNNCSLTAPLNQDNNNEELVAARRRADRRGDRDSSDESDHGVDAQLLCNDPEYEIAEAAFGQAQALVQTKQRRRTLAAAKRSVTTANTSSNDTTTTTTSTTGDVIQTCSIVTRSSQRRLKEPKIEIKPRSTSKDNQEIVLDLGKTLPFSFMLSSVVGFDEIGQNPAHYVHHDGKNSWKVRFPHLDYVALKLDFDAYGHQEMDEIVDEPQYTCQTCYIHPATGLEVKRPLVRLSKGTCVHSINVPLQNLICTPEET